MFLSEQLNADVKAIIDEGMRESFGRFERAHRLYVRLTHARKWNAKTAFAVYHAWESAIRSPAEVDDDIPF
jgi:hypothetical protein